MSSCSLCLEVNSAEVEVWNTPLYETDNFVAVPSLGSLVPGWVLVVPKEHVISCGALDYSLVQEFLLFKSEVAEAVSSRYGAATAFEHGPAAPHRTVGCTVDHAHLHVVPLAFDLATASLPYLPPGSTWSTATLGDCRRAHRAGLDYLYIEQVAGRDGQIVAGNNFGSQTLRRAIASVLGTAGEWNWREYPQLDVVAQTISSFTHSSVQSANV